MELRHLQALQAVLDEGTFAAAARKRHLTQPALWAQVKALEDTLGVPLFRRQGRGVVPTAACRDLEPRIRGFLAEAGGIVDLAAAIRAGTAAPARIGCVTHQLTHFVAPAIGRLLREHPGSPLPLISTPRVGLDGQEALAQGLIDLLVYSLPPRADAQGVELYPVYGAVVGPIARGQPVDVRELADVPLALPPPASNTRQLMDRAFAVHGIRPRIVTEFADADALLAYARHGLANALVPSESVPEGVRWSRLTIDGRTLRRSIWLHWSDSAALSPAARRMRDALKATGAERAAAMAFEGEDEPG